MFFFGVNIGDSNVIIMCRDIVLLYLMYLLMFIKIWL